MINCFECSNDIEDRNVFLPVTRERRHGLATAILYLSERVDRIRCIQIVGLGLAISRTLISFSKSMSK